MPLSCNGLRKPLIGKNLNEAGKKEEADTSSGTAAKMTEGEPIYDCPDEDLRQTGS